MAISHLTVTLAKPIYIGLSVFGAVYDMSFTVEMVNVLKRRMSPWGMEHTFAYLPGYSVALTPVAWITQSAAGIAMGAKFLNLGFLIWFGVPAGRIAFPEVKDSICAPSFVQNCASVLGLVSGLRAFLPVRP